MTVTSRDNWTFGAQIATAVGMFLVTLGILFIATLTYLDREDKEFRDEVRSELKEMRTEFVALRTEFSSMRSEIHDMNTRLGRVEGYLRVSGGD